MEVNLRHMKIFIQTIALVFFILQVTFAVQHYLAKPTMTSPGLKSLSSLEKPLLIAVCKTSQFNYTRGYELGYNLSARYFAGRTNDDELSWAGQHGNLTWNETFNYLHNPGLDNINFEVDSGNITTKMLLPNGLCKVYEGKPLNTLTISFTDKEPSKHSEYIVFVSDPAAANSFQLPYSLLTGETIRPVFFSKVKRFACYNIKLKETIIGTNDGSCVGYRTPRHQSYSDCVDDELRALILPTLGCMVPWMSNADGCTGTLQIKQKHQNILQMLLTLNYVSWGGIQYKSDACPLPCSLISANAKFQQSGVGIQHDTVYLDFEEDIKVEKIVLAYGFTSLLVEIGSSLGLWIGKTHNINMLLNHFY